MLCAGGGPDTVAAEPGGLSLLTPRPSVLHHQAPVLYGQQALHAPPQTGKGEGGWEGCELRSRSSSQFGPETNPTAARYKDKFLMPVF